MRVAICAQDKDQQAPVDPRFARCPYFVVYDSEPGTFEAFPNPSVNAPGGAGIEAADFLSAKGVQVLLTGNIGPTAANALAASGIQVFTGISGSVVDALESYSEQLLTPVSPMEAGPTPGQRAPQGGRGQRRPGQDRPGTQPGSGERGRGRRGQGRRKDQRGSGGSGARGSGGGRPRRRL